MTTVKSFTIYKEFNDLIKLLKDDQKEAMVVYAIWKYMFEDEYIYLDEDQLAIFNNLKKSFMLGISYSDKSGFDIPLFNTLNKYM